MIGTVAALRQEKNIARLLRAFAALPSGRLVIVGDGPERAALEALAAIAGHRRPGPIRRTPSGHRAVLRRVRYLRPVLRHRTDAAVGDRGDGERTARRGHRVGDVRLDGGGGERAVHHRRWTMSAWPARWQRWPAINRSRSGSVLPTWRRRGAISTRRRCSPPMARCGVGFDDRPGRGGVEDFAALGERWRDLEQRADGSFFQSWTWVGCLAAERFPDPVLVEATEDGRTVALACSTASGASVRAVRRCIWARPGSPELDCPYVEQNGILAEAGREAGTDGAMPAAVGPQA